VVRVVKLGVGMGASVRTRPRRLLLVAAAIALSAGLFLAIQTPLWAQDDSPVVGFNLPGDNATVTRSQVAQGDEQSFIVGSGDSRKRRTYRGLTFSEMLNAAAAQRGAPIDGVGVYALNRDPLPPLYLDDGSQVFFFLQGSLVRWLLYDDRRRVIDGGNGEQLQITGLEGEHLDVTIATSPTADIRAGDEVTFTATAANGEDGEKFRYYWFVDGGEEIAGRAATFKHKFDNRGGHSVYVDVRGDGDSRGAATATVDVAKKKAPAQQGGGGGGSGGTSPGGNSGGGGGGSFSPSPTPAPVTPSLPPPSSSPPSDPGRGPNLDPSAPDTGATDTGQEVEGILVSTSAPAKPGQTRPGQAAQAQQKQAKKNDEPVDWKLAGGISLTALLVILGAVRERMHLQRLLPQLS
jgi:hypothetical protein